VAGFVGDFAFDVADYVAAANHFAFGAEAASHTGRKKLIFSSMW